MLVNERDKGDLKMTYYLYMDNRMVAEVNGCDVAYAAYEKLCEVAEMTGCEAYLVDATTGEVVACSCEE